MEHPIESKDQEKLPTMSEFTESESGVAIQRSTPNNSAKLNPPLEAFTSEEQSKDEIMKKALIELELTRDELQLRSDSRDPFVNACMGIIRVTLERLPEEYKLQYLMEIFEVLQRFVPDANI